jgi:hypothetical protein
MENVANSREHVPAQSAGNAGEVFLVDTRPVGDGYRRIPLQGGFWRRTTCVECNGRGERNAREYAKLVDAVRRTHVDDIVECFLEPRRVIREAITLLLASTRIAPPPAWSPLRAFVIDDAAVYRDVVTCAMPRIFLFRNTAEVGRIAPLFEMRRIEDRAVVFLAAEFSFPPLGVVVAFRGAERLALNGFTEITNWATYATGERTTMQLALRGLRVEGLMPLVFGSPAEAERAHEGLMVGYYAPTGVAAPGSLCAIVGKTGNVIPESEIVVLDTRDIPPSFWSPTPGRRAN